MRRQLFVREDPLSMPSSLRQQHAHAIDSNESSNKATTHHNLRTSSTVVDDRRVRRRRSRKIQEDCPDDDTRHCSFPPEQDTENVFVRKNTCQVDSNGDFFLPNTAASNKSNNDDKSALQSIVVEFQYQIQTSVSQTPQVLNGPTSPLKAIETQISNVLTQSFFKEADCTVVASTTTTTSNRPATATTSSSTLFEEQGTAPSTSFPKQVNIINTTVPPYPILGLSAAPADEILPGLDGVKCRTQSQRPDDRCYIIRGRVTTFWGNNNETVATVAAKSMDSRSATPNNNNLTWWATDAVKMVTKQAMENGEFNDVHPEIHDIFFITKLPFDPNNATSFGGESPIVRPDDDGDQQPREVDDSNEEAWPWIMLSLGICCSILLLWVVRKLARRHKCQRMRMSPTTDSGGSTLLLQPPLVASSSSSITTTATPSPTKGTTTGTSSSSSSQIATQRSAKLDPVPENDDPDKQQPSSSANIILKKDDDDASGHSLT